MFVVRPVRINDLPQLLALSALAAAGITTFPNNKRILKKRIEDSVRDFEAHTDRARGEIYFFVMEDLMTQRLVGTCAIVAKIGGFHPSYTYQIKNTRKRSRELGVKKALPYLVLKKEYDGPTEVGTLFLHPNARSKGLGRTLSLSRFIFMAQYPRLFERMVIAELRGILDKHDRSPFWNAVGKHFFDMEFKKADLMSMEDKSFIAELNPEHPIYIPLLPLSAQQAIGAVHKNTRPAQELLAQENFTFINEIDIFEAGPVVGCPLKKIRTVRESRLIKVLDIARTVDRKKLYLIARTGEMSQFRAIGGTLKMKNTGVVLEHGAAKALNIQPGDNVRISPLYGRRQ